LILASIEVLKGNPTKILPDFANGGFIDVTDYNSAERGSKIRCRAKMEVADKKNNFN
jgi:topoisomerase-4 subunit A